MAHHLGIFIQSEQALDEFAREVGEVLRIPLERRTDEGDTWYDHGDPDVYLTLGENRLEGNRDLLLAGYRYHIALWPRRRSSPDEIEERWRSELGPAMFESLRAGGRYTMLLVEGVQRKLAEYRPRAAVTP